MKTLSIYLKPSNIITPCNNYKLPDDSEIKYMFEELGYEGFIPNGLLYSLVCAASYNKYIKYVIPKTKMTKGEKLIQKFIGLLDFKQYSGSPLGKAVQILIDFQDKINYRSFEIGDLSVQYTGDNRYTRIQSELDQELQEIIEANSISTKHLAGIEKLLDSIETNIESKKSIISRGIRKIRSFGEISRMNLSKLANPLTKYHLATKQINIVTKDVKDKVREKLLFIDTSLSMYEYDPYVISLISYLDYNDIKCDMYSMNSDGGTKIGNDREFEYIVGPFNISKIIKNIYPYHGSNLKEITIFTDNQDDLNLDWFCGVVNIISPVDNESSRRLCYNKNGKYYKI